MFRFTLRCTIALALVYTSLSGKQLEVNVSAESAILMNADTGVVLFEKKSHIPQHPASTIKTATALYALEKKRDALDEMVTVDAESIKRISPRQKRKDNYAAPSYILESDARTLKVQAGERFSLRALITGMLVSSYGDLSNIIARHVGRSIPSFIEELNAYLQELGCKETHVTNPHGLHHPDQVSSAYDLALITKRALDFPEFREMVRMETYTMPATNKTEARAVPQTNRLLRRGRYYYPYAIGVKTGYTSASGHTLIAAAEKEGRRLIAVLLQCDQRSEIFDGARQLFDAAYSEALIRKRVFHAGVQDQRLTVSNASEPVPCALLKDVYLEYYPSENPDARAELVWRDKIRAPIEKGQTLGEIQIRAASGRLIDSHPLVAAKKVDRSFWAWFMESNAWILALGLGMLCGYLVHASRNTAHRRRY